MVAKRKTRKDERELPPAARENPYALLSREELDAALKKVDAESAALAEGDEARVDLDERRSLVLDGYLWRLVRMGLADWSGGKPKGSKDPVKLPAGVTTTQLVREGRR